MRRARGSSKRPDTWHWEFNDTRGEEKPRYGYGARNAVFATATATEKERLLVFTWTGLDEKAHMDLSKLYTLHLTESPMRWSVMQVSDQLGVIGKKGVGDVCVSS